MSASSPESARTRPYPLAVLLLWQTGSVIMTLLGLMSATQSKVSWRSWLHDVMSFYRRHVSEPIRGLCAELVRWIEANFDTDLSWLVVWFPEYLPIASAFFVGLVTAYCYVSNMGPMDIARRFFREEVAPAFNRGFMDGVGAILGGAIAAVVYPIGLLLVSPVLFLIVPAFIIVMLAFAIALWGSLLMLAIRFGVPAALVIAVLWFLFFRPSFLIAFGKLKVWAKQRLLLMTQRGPTLLRDFFTRAGAELFQPQSEFRTELRFWRRLVFWQYTVACLLGILFLVLVSVNYSLTS